MLTNGEVSKILADMWRDAPPEQKQMYQNAESKLRREYKASVSKRKPKGKNKSASPTVVECVSVSSSLETPFEARFYQSNDDDDQSLLSFASVLESLCEEEEHTDSMSDSSRAHSILQDTARVTLPDESCRSVSVDAQVVPGYLISSGTLSQSNLLLNPTGLPELSTRYPLKPLIDTDFGGFLAVAAMLDNASEKLLG